MSRTPAVLLIPDAGPLITLAYAAALDVLFAPGWDVKVTDMVLYELTRRKTPTSTLISTWISAHNVPVLPTKTYARLMLAPTAGAQHPKKANLGERAVQEIMHHLAADDPAQRAFFLFEDHKIARDSFVLPITCHKISTRAFLTFLEQQGLIASAAAIEQAARSRGRHFSSLRIPKE